MNTTEAVRLVHLVETLCPAQKIADDTAAVWSVVLADVSLTDALAVVKDLAKSREFIAPAQIIPAVDRLRRDRAAKTTLPVPNVDPDDALAYAAELQALEHARYDGTLDVERYERGGLTLTGARPMRALDAVKPHPLAIAGTFQDVPRG